MTSDRGLTLFRHTTLLCAALAFSLGSASAQIATTPIPRVREPRLQRNPVRIHSNLPMTMPVRRVPDLQRCLEHQRQTDRAAGSTITGLTAEGAAES